MPRVPVTYIPRGCADAPADSPIAASSVQPTAARCPMCMKAPIRLNGGTSVFPMDRWLAAAEGVLGVIGLTGSDLYERRCGAGGAVWTDARWLPRPLEHERRPVERGRRFGPVADRALRVAQGTGPFDLVMVALRIRHRPEQVAHE